MQRLMRSLALVALCLAALTSAVDVKHAIRIDEAAPPSDPRINVEQRPGAENTTIVVHVVNDNDGRIPSAPPTPPSIPAARLGVPLEQPRQPACQGDLITCAAANTVPATNAGATTNMGLVVSPAAPMSAAADLINPQPIVQANLQPAPLSVTTPAADLLPASQVNPITSPVAPDRIGTFAVQTVAGVRIVGEGDDKCNCQEGDPCQCRMSPTDQIEAALDRVKTEIVVQAQKVQQENRWVRSVKRIIKHYEKKISKVNTHVGQVKEDIKKLFAKKKHYENLLLQHQLDQEAFNKASKNREYRRQRAEEKRQERLQRACDKLRNPSGC